MFVAGKSSPKGCRFARCAKTIAVGVVQLVWWIWVLAVVGIVVAVTDWLIVIGIYPQGKRCKTNPQKGEKARMRFNGIFRRF